MMEPSEGGVSLLHRRGSSQSSGEKRYLPSAVLLPVRPGHEHTGGDVPTLWIYVKDDSYFDPDLSKRMADAYRAAGGNVDYNLLPAVRDEEHFLTGHPDAPALRGPIVEKFLAKIR